MPPAGTSFCQEREAAAATIARTVESISDLFIDLGCGLSNSTLLDQVERQRSCHYEESTSSQHPLRLNVHFLYLSNEAIQRLRVDSRYKCRAAQDEQSTEEPESTAADATVTSQVCDLASMGEAAAHLDQPTDIVMMLFPLSAMGPCRERHPDAADAVRHAARMLRPGGTIMVRDYGQYDDDRLRTGQENF